MPSSPPPRERGEQLTDILASMVCSALSWEVANGRPAATIQFFDVIGHNRPATGIELSQPFYSSQAKWPGNEQDDHPIP